MKDRKPIKVSAGMTEEGVVVGNSFDKYGSRNPLVKWMLGGFENTLETLVQSAAPQTIHEIGCGEGYWAITYANKGFSVKASDFSQQVINIAKHNALAANLEPGMFDVRNIYDMRPARDSADLIVCCEVLEHLEHPEQALETLASLNAAHYIFSVPHEPIWRLLNMVRLKYLSDFGNTPGHIQHWSKKAFVALLKKYFQLDQVSSPLPWTMVYCRLKDS